VREAFEDALGKYNTVETRARSPIHREWMRLAGDAVRA
jgi:hypothetical protein